MITEFRPWLALKVTPERYAQLTKLLDLLIAINGTEFQEIETTLWSVIGVEDDYAILDRLNSEVLRWGIATILRFGIVIEEAEIDTGSVGILADVLETLTTLDNYEIPQDILTILDNDEIDFSTSMAQLVSLITARDEFDVAPMIGSVSPSFVESLREACQFKIAVDEPLTDEDLAQAKATDTGTVVSDKIPTPQIVENLKQAIVNLTMSSEDPIVMFFEREGKIGLPIEAYVSVLGEYLLEEVSADVIAKRWVLLTISSGEDSSQVTKLFELIYPDIRRIMSINREYTRYMS